MCLRPSITLYNCRNISNMIPLLMEIMHNNLALKLVIDNFQFIMPACFCKARTL
jgi:hypothetical protein